jgi:hypothetical protein
MLLAVQEFHERQSLLGQNFVNLAIGGYRTFVFKTAILKPTISIDSFDNLF